MNYSLMSWSFTALSHRIIPECEMTPLRLDGVCSKGLVGSVSGRNSSQPKVLHFYSHMLCCKRAHTLTLSPLHKERHIIHRDEAHLPALWCYAQFSKHLQHLFAQRVSVNERCSSLFVNLLMSRFVLLVKIFPVKQLSKMKRTDCIYIAFTRV